MFQYIIKFIDFILISLSLLAIDKLYMVFNGENNYLIAKFVGGTINYEILIIIIETIVACLLFVLLFKNIVDIKINLDKRIKLLVTLIFVICLLMYNLFWFIRMPYWLALFVFSFKAYAPFVFGCWLGALCIENIRILSSKPFIKNEH